MRFLHPPSGRRLRLGYCMNLHPADTVDGVMDAMHSVTLPLARRLAGGTPFGVGLYLPAALAARLAGPEGSEGADDLARLGDFLDEHDLDPFTFNAFPAAGFGDPGLKSRVFEPTWADPARLAFTRDVAKVAAELVEGGDRHISISTHPGMHRSALSGNPEQDRLACADNLARACAELARLEQGGAPPIVLSLEAEPRASANDTGELADFLDLVRERGRATLRSEGVSDPDRVLSRHLGVCLDTCHAAVEFEESAAALDNATRGGTPLGKIQFSSALSLAAPDGDALGRGRLLSLDEPVYLHQVTGRNGDELLRVGDLSELAQVFETGGSEWTACSEWRCHFHVPVHIGGEIDRQSAGGLATTRAFADVLLARALANPGLWGTDELHLEIETYTWDVMPSEARGRGSLVEGLRREYAHVTARLEAAGWRRDPGLRSTADPIVSGGQAGPSEPTSH